MAPKNALMQELMTPGSTVFVVALNTVLLVLFGVMLSVIWMDVENSIHSYVMLFLIGGLTVSINWFMLQVRAIKQNQAEGAAKDGNGTNKAPAKLAKTD